MLCICRKNLHCILKKYGWDDANFDIELKTTLFRGNNLIYEYLTSHIFFLHLKFKVLKESAFGFTPIKFTCALSFVTGLILPSSQQKIQITWISPSWYMDLLIDVFHQINRAKLSSENPNLSDIMNLKCIVYFSSDLRFVKKFARPEFRTKNFTHKKCVNCDYFYSKGNSVNALI